MGRRLLETYICVVLEQQVSGVYYVCLYVGHGLAIHTISFVDLGNGCWKRALAVYIESMFSRLGIGHPPPSDSILCVVLLKGIAFDKYAASANWIVQNKTWIQDSSPCSPCSHSAICKQYYKHYKSPLVRSKRIRSTLIHTNPDLYKSISIHTKRSTKCTQYAREPTLIIF